jgi:hypothetical protein
MPPRDAGPISSSLLGAFVLALTPAIGLAGCGAIQSPQSAERGETSPFAVLRAAPTIGDALPLSVARRLLESEGPNLSRRDIQGARRVLTNHQGWLIAGPGGELCLVRLVYPLVPGSHGEHLPPSVGLVCSSEAAAKGGRLMETRSLSTTLAKRLPTLVDGIVPDGVRRVVVDSTGGAHQKVVPVVRNAYEVVVVNPSSVSFVARQAGRRRLDVIPTPSTAGGRPYPSRSHRKRSR